MKILITLSVLALVGVSIGEECEKGTYHYYIKQGPFVIEPNCDNPHQQSFEDAIVNDYSACFCEPPTVREIVSSKCVPVDQCPKTDFGSWFKENPELQKDAAKPKA